MSDPVSHEDIYQRLEHIEQRLFDGDRRFDENGGAFTQIADTLSAMSARFDSIEAQLAENTRITGEVKTLTETSRAVKWLGEKVIWLGRVLASWGVIITTLLAVIKWQLWRVIGGE